jgi:hypothetical protein
VVALRSTLANNSHLVWSVYRGRAVSRVYKADLHSVALMVRRSYTVSSTTHKWRSLQHCHTASVLSPNNRDRVATLQRLQISSATRLPRL